MSTIWQSKKQYEHPAPHQAGVFGYVCISGVGVYALKVGASIMSCPQDWASKIHAQEMAQQNVIREALTYIRDAIERMEASKTAFKSAQIAEARESAQKAKEILEKTCMIMNEKHKKHPLAPFDFINSKRREVFIEGKDIIHFVEPVACNWEDSNIKIIIEKIESRGAIRGLDYIVELFLHQPLTFEFAIALHIPKCFLLKDDFFADRIDRAYALIFPQWYIFIGVNIGSGL